MLIVYIFPLWPVHVMMCQEFLPSWFLPISTVFFQIAKGYVMFVSPLLYALIIPEGFAQSYALRLLFSCVCIICIIEIIMGAALETHIRREISLFF